MPRQRRTPMMCNDCAHFRTTSRAGSLIDRFPVIVTPSILSAVTRSMPGRHCDRLKARLLRRLSLRSSSVNNVAACNPPPSPICSERNDVTSKAETEPENWVWPFPKLKNRFYKRNPVLIVGFIRWMSAFFVDGWLTFRLTSSLSDLRFYCECSLSSVVVAILVADYLVCLCR